MNDVEYYNKQREKEIREGKMKRFKVEFTVTEVNAYNAIVEAETPEEAAQKFFADASDYEWNQDELINSDIHDDSIEVVGEYIPDEDHNSYSLERFNEPIPLFK